MIEIYFDGACGPNNPGGKCGGGAVIKKDNEILAEIAERYQPKEIGQTSNNVGEYFALLKALEYLFVKNLHKEPIMVYGDSNMVINQMSGNWKINTKHKKIYTEIGLHALEFGKNFSLIRYEWIPREQNEHADELSKIALTKPLTYNY